VIVSADHDRRRVRRPAADRSRRGTPTSGALGYDVERNGFGSITSVADADGVGLDHDATFAYDTAGRLTEATVGSGMAAYSFSYQYDGLQNMVQRAISGPTSLGALVGEYQYGEGMKVGGGAHGPRQLTSVRPLGSPMDPAVASFKYDAAGRLVEQDSIDLIYNGLDQLKRVEGLGAGTDVVEHAYGYDGFRVLTRSPVGDVQYWFTPGISERNGIREHYIRLGDRLIARVDQRDTEGGGGGGGFVVDGGHRAGRMLVLMLMLLSLGLALAAVLGAAGRGRWVRATSGLVAGAIALSGCGLFTANSWTHEGTTYFHQGVSPGPTLMTREDGTVLEERRYEPFGEELDAYREVGGTGSIGSIDYTVDSHNILNKQTDSTTGWSYHGARWMAPETARWLTPDPPVKAPDPKLVLNPSSAHPYQYVGQNPIAFWDPDGRERLSSICGNRCDVGGPEALPGPGLWTYAGEGAIGVGEGIWGGAKGLAAAVWNWKASGEALGSAVVHPVRTWERVRDRAVSAIETIAEAEPRAVGRLAGGAAFTLGTTAAGSWLSQSIRGARTASVGAAAGMGAKAAQQGWRLAGFKTAAKWESQLAKRRQGKSRRQCGMAKGSAPRIL
jgi:RHS repeat-associated protein